MTLCHRQLKQQKKISDDDCTGVHCRRGGQQKTLLAGDNCSSGDAKSITIKTKTYGNSRKNTSAVDKQRYQDTEDEVVSNHPVEAGLRKKCLNSKKKKTTVLKKKHHVVQADNAGTATNGSRQNGELHSRSDDVAAEKKWSDCSFIEQPTTATRPANNDHHPRSSRNDDEEEKWRNNSPSMSMEEKKQQPRASRAANGQPQQTSKDEKKEKWRNNSSSMSMEKQQPRASRAASGQHQRTNKEDEKEERCVISSSSRDEPEAMRAATSSSLSLLSQLFAALAKVSEDNYENPLLPSSSEDFVTATSEQLLGKCVSLVGNGEKPCHGKCQDDERIGFIFKKKGTTTSDGGNSTGDPHPGELHRIKEAAVTDDDMKRSLCAIATNDNSIIPSVIDLTHLRLLLEFTASTELMINQLG